MKIVGLDLSLTSTGVALPDGHTVTLHPKQYAVTGRRLNELWGLLYPLLDRHRPDVAVVEGYAYGANMPGSERRAEWVGCARLALERFRIPHIDVPPKKLKKWATGNGNADKAAMVQAALAAGGDPANDDEADAYLLRAMALETITARAAVDERDRFTLAGRP